MYDTSSAQSKVKQPKNRANSNQKKITKQDSDSDSDSNESNDNDLNNIDDSFDQSQMNEVRTERRDSMQPILPDVSYSSDSNQHGDDASFDMKGYQKFGDYKRFVWQIPHRFEMIFKSFDDKFISMIQGSSRPKNKFSIFLAYAITVITTIEIGAIIPFIAFGFAIDDLASLFLWINITLVTVSQLPKRFLWRTRPHLKHRAFKVDGAKTSSFPSRAVTCSIIYALEACITLQYFIAISISSFHQSYESLWIWKIITQISFWIYMPFIVAIFALITSWARIYLGVHYPSDCLFGAFQAMVVIILGFSIYFLQSLICPSCTTYIFFEQNYCNISSTNSLSDGFTMFHNWNKLNYWLLIAFSTGFMILCFIAVSYPVHFYTKFHNLFGTLLPCVTFQYIYLCPRLSLNGKSSLFVMSWYHYFTNWYSYLVVLFSALMFTFLGLIFPKGFLKSLYFFPILYLVILAFMALWRLSPSNGFLYYSNPL